MTTASRRRSRVEVADLPAAHPANRVPLLLAAFAVRRACGPLRGWEKLVVVACVSLVLAEQFRGSLSTRSAATGRKPGSMATRR